MLQRPVVIVDQLDTEQHVLEDVDLTVTSLEKARLDLDEEVAITCGWLEPSFCWVKPDFIRETIEHLPNQGSWGKDLTGYLDAFGVSRCHLSAALICACSIFVRLK